MTWENDPLRHKMSALGIETSTKFKSKGIPGIGIVTPKHDISSYSKEKLDEKIHHSFILDEEDVDLWDNYDENLRFVVYNKHKIGIKGKPSLQPFEKSNYEMIQRLAQHLYQNGIPKDAEIYVDVQQSDSKFETKTIGTVDELRDGEK